MAEGVVSHTAQISSTAYERYQQRLAVLAADEPVISAIERRGALCAWWTAGRSWWRVFGRFNPDHNAYASLVFESNGDPQALMHVEVCTSRASVQRADEMVAFDPNLGWLHVVPFPADQALDTLSAVLAEGERATVVRYRPQRRCTIRVEQDGRTRFVKVYTKKFLRDGRGEQLHLANVSLCRAAARGEFDFAVAEPVRWDPQTRTLWQEKLDGKPAVARLFGEDGYTVARRMGGAAASLTLSGAEPKRIFDATAQLSASRRYGTELYRRVPRLTREVNSLLETLEQIHAATDDRPFRPIHGDMDAHQWLNDEKQLGLVDFDDFALGDPELDVATFIVELEFEEDGPQLPLEQLAAAFLDGYEATVGRLDRKLLGAYLAHKRLFKALRSARALQPDGDRCAERHLARACGYCERASVELFIEDLVLV